MVTESEPRFPITLFRDKLGLQKFDRTTTLPEMAEKVAQVRRPTKERLWLWKMATFGDVPNPDTKSGCLRYDKNVLTVTGVLVDYDAERVSFSDAVAMVGQARLRALLYTSPSHTTEKPRWRAAFPFAGATVPAGHAPMVARANAVFGGILASESFQLSQPYYWGIAEPTAEHFRSALTEGDFIDTRPDLGMIGLPITEPVLIGPARSTEVLDNYGARAVRRAAERILAAPDGQQRSTLNGQAYSIGRLAGAGGVPADVALDVLLLAAHGIPSYKPRKPWRPGQAEAIVRSAFASGVARPRVTDWLAVEREFDRAMGAADAG